jgi:cytochrome P450
MPFARSERGLEVLSYRCCEDVLRDPGLAVGFEEMLEACGIGNGPAHASLSRNINNIEGEAHARQRRAIAPYFQPARVETMRQTLRRALEKRFVATRELGRCDIVDLVGRWLPTTSFCMMAEAPFEDRPFIWRMSDEVQRFFQMKTSERGVVERGFGELESYVDSLIAARRAEPGDDLISFLLAEERSSALSMTEVRDLVVILVLASTDTTNAQTACVFKALAQHPEQWRALRSDPTLIPNAVLEASRYEPGVWAMTRVAREPAEVTGVPLEAGTHLFVDFIAANRDPDVFPSPDELDVRRQMKRPPLNWSVGRHFCPGRPLAVLEMEETLRVALRQWETVELEGDLESHGAPYVISAERLPVRFEPAIV